MAAIVAISQVKSSELGGCHSGAVAWFFVGWRRAERSPTGGHYCAKLNGINKDVADPQK